ncbi:FemAB family XrtA/PEP-CTERM system-associated protein [Geomonas azotofigens]|uniref:FemAB family XrtA/PEP-CTERM system-associated protein n=1 Tax=Geomonas azotofigens TaxID=2843196 RepID=UPI001C10B9AD|nr:FemAB family XrtA/PEP-CTERM system-associated protein [Geomonas azotofigens]MBU5613489.1 FemAB family PEP-CTERM system-associated protein [Geomonas azotofigens]
MSGVTVELYRGDGVEWDRFVATQPGATSYHRYLWKDVVHKSFGHTGYYLMARRGAEPVGVLPLFHMKSVFFGNFLVSVPFFNYGGVLAGDPAAVQPLLDEGANVMARCRATHLELRHLGAPLAGLATRSHKVTMILDLAAELDNQWRGFDPKLRNQVRKAQKSGLHVVTGGPELLDGFYRVFCRNMRDLGTPVYGREFFENVLRAPDARARVVSVLRGGETVASGIMTRFRDAVEVPWASSIRDYRELCPNNLLYWEAIRLAIEEGALCFDFGRSTPGEGTYQFKKQWGARAVALHWQYLLAPGAHLPDLNPSNPKFRMAVEGWRRLPVALTRFLGPAIVRNIP